MAKTPGWAFSRGCIKEFNAYLKKRKDDLPPGGGEEAGLPWQKPGGEDDEEQDGPSELGEEDLKEKLKEAREASWDLWWLSLVLGLC